MFTYYLYKKLLLEMFLMPVLGQGSVRQAALDAGNTTIIAISTSINKVCISRMKSIMFVAQNLQLCTNDIAVAGGMESMSNVPKNISEARKGSNFENDSLVGGILKAALWDIFNEFKMGNVTAVDTYYLEREHLHDQRCNLHCF
ncbi:hypothetical protein L1887_18377 [Cichorium endivia]|nr:hypothetical protein L1887_18377 [Cichorium endivia]